MAIGCGGGGGGLPPSPTPSPTPTPTPGRLVTPKITIRWAARSRDIDAPTSALMARITIVGVQGDTVGFDAPRPSGAVAAIASEYTAPFAIQVADQVAVQIEFFADRGASGASVAQASATLAITENGSISAPITNIQSKIVRVDVVSELTMEVGEQIYVDYTARDANGTIIALSPGSAFFRVVSGSEKLRANGEILEGLASGSASIVAAIDGVQSSNVNITILAQIRVAYIDNSLQPVAKGLTDLIQKEKVTFTTYSNLPSPLELQSFDVLIIGQYGNITASSAAQVKSFIDSGRGVVLLMAAPAVLAGNIASGSSKKDLTSISTWFGAISMSTFSVSYDIKAKQVAGILPLPTSITPGSFVHPSSSNYLDRDNNVLPTVDRILESGSGKFIHATAYSDGLSGRVYWQFHPYGTSGKPADNEKIFSLLMAGIRWTAKR